jgi:hypothetical protein
MGELNEEKLKQMLDEHAMNIQASINDVYKEIKQIRNTLEKQDRSSSQLWLSAIGVAIIGIGGSMLSSATTTPDKIQDGFVVVAGFILFLIGLSRYNRVSNRKDTHYMDSK